MIGERYGFIDAIENSGGFPFGLSKICTNLVF